MSATPHLVRDVVGVRSDFKMLRINAAGVVASVADDQPFRNMSDHLFIEIAVGLYTPPVPVSVLTECNLAIALTAIPLPFPAARFRVYDIAVEHGAIMHD